MSIGGGVVVDGGEVVEGGEVVDGGVAVLGVVDGGVMVTEGVVVVDSDAVDDGVVDVGVGSVGATAAVSSSTAASAIAWPLATVAACARLCAAFTLIVSTITARWQRWAFDADTRATPIRWRPAESARRIVNVA